MRYFMPIVSTQWLPISNDNSPHTANLDTQIDLALLLSEFYGKNIRQGNNFRLKGIQASLRPADYDNSKGVDTGLSVQCQAQFIPTTKHSRDAWNNVFNQWKSQQRLRTELGRQTRYNDMEFCWEASKATSRTSSVYSSGIGDASAEDLCLVGQSSSGTDFVLRDYWNSSFAPPPASKDHFDNAVIKEPKMGTTPFPEDQCIHFSAFSSSIMTDYTLAGTDVTTYSGSGDSNPMLTLPKVANILCGLMRIQAWVSPDDTAAQIEEDYAIKYTFVVESWKSLCHTSKPYYPRKKKGKKSQKSKSRRYRSYSRKYYRFN